MRILACIAVLALFLAGFAGCEKKDQAVERINKARELKEDLEKKAKEMKEGVEGKARELVGETQKKARELKESTDKKAQEAGEEVEKRIRPKSGDKN